MDNEAFKIHFKWVGSATWVLKINDLKVACDPVLCPKNTVQVYAPGFKSKRLTDPVFDSSVFHDVDLWLISHEHEDHLDSYGMLKIDPEAVIISSRKAGKMIRKINPKNLKVLNWGQSVSYKFKRMTAEITAIPTVHASNFVMAYVLGGGNGYWLRIRNDDAVLNIYITGDTVSHKRVMSALQGLKADILIPNVGAPFQNAFGGPFTFTIKNLKTVIDTITPDIILPVHFGTFSHFHEPRSAIEDWADERVKIHSEGDCFQN